MKHLRILSINLGRGFIPIKDKRKKEFLREKIDTEKYNIVMLQGNRISSDVFFRNLGYNYVDFSKNVITLVSGREIIENNATDVFNCSITSNIDNKPVALINVNCKSLKNMDEVFRVCEAYSKKEDVNYVRTRIVAGRFPREVDINLFCDRFDLTDVSTSVGQESHIKNNRDMLNHFFISRNLEIDSIHKLVGMTEESKIGEAYPIEASISYKKVK